MLEIRLRLPSRFERSQPRVRCDRLIASSEYAIDPVGDNADIPEPPKPAPDPGLAGYVRNGLTFLGDEGVWRLNVRRPMVGYLPLNRSESKERRGADEALLNWLVSTT